ncbi:hypothetical protein MMC30_006220 [Trapelia coarctata]|nr:hypothetical protein [Trapelia coarctata]
MFNSRFTSKACLLSSVAVPGRAVLGPSPFIRQYAKLTGPGAERDPFNTPLALQRLRRHLGLSSYAASAKEAELGRKTDSILSRVNTHGDKGSFPGVVWKALWVIMDHSIEAAQKKNSYDLKVHSLSEKDHQVINNTGQLLVRLNRQLAWGRGSFDECILVFFTVLFWWMDWPPVSWIRGQFGQAAEKAEPERISIHIDG